MSPARVYLTGFMGCGKSTVGPILANVIGYRFHDLDAALAAAAGQSVADLFAAEGEAAFRAREAAALRATGRETSLVVATGGGALTRDPSMAWALERGTVAYLRMPHEALVARLLRVRETRPMLLDADGERLGEAELAVRVTALFAAREPFYTRAHVTVDVGERGVGGSVDELAKALRRLWRSTGRTARGGAAPTGVS